MDDLIRRRDAVDAVRRLQTYKLSEGDDMLLVDKAEVQTELMMLPSAQREFAKDTNVPINDCISRQAAIDAIKQVAIHAEDESLAVEALENLSSAQRKGKWMGTLFVCSVCGSGVRLMGKPMFEYCPWCGARTEKGKKNEAVN